MKHSYDSYQSLILVNRNISKGYFLNRAGAVGGYAKDMFSRIYDCIFSEAESVDEIYQRYYKDEYDDIRSYIYHKYCIDNESLQQILDLKSSNDDYILYDFDELNYGDSSSIVFAFSEDMYTRITNILLMKE